MEKYTKRTQLIQCFNCYEYEHHAKACQAKTCCEKCGESHETQSCKNITIKCCQCKEFHEAKNSQRNKASAITQIHHIQAHTPRNQIREREEGKGEERGITRKLQRQQTLILIYIAKFFKV